MLSTMRYKYISKFLESHHNGNFTFNTQFLCLYDAETYFHLDSSVGQDKRTLMCIFRNIEKSTICTYLNSAHNIEQYKIRSRNLHIAQGYACASSLFFAPFTANGY